MSGLYRYIWSLTSRQQILLITLSTMISVLAMVPLEFQRHIINGLAGHETVERLGWLCGGYLAASVSLTGLKWILNLRSNTLGELSVRRLREQLFDNRTAFLEDTSNTRPITDQTGTLVTMISSEAEKVGHFVGEAISAPLVQIGTFISILGYMLVTEPKLGMIVFLLAIPQAALVPLVQKKINLLIRERVKTLRKASDLIVSDIRDGVGDDASGVKPAFDSILNLQLGVIHLKFGSRALINGLNVAAMTTILFVGGWMVLSGRTEIGIVVAFLSGLDKIVDPSRQFIAFFRSVSALTVQFDLISQATGGKLTAGALRS